jgi:hypothetical protein
MLKKGYVILKVGRDELGHGCKRRKDWGMSIDHRQAAGGRFWSVCANGGLLSKAAISTAGNRPCSTRRLSKEANAGHQALHGDRIESVKQEA